MGLTEQKTALMQKHISRNVETYITQPTKGEQRMENETFGKHPCKKCLLADLQEDQVLARIRQLLDLMPEKEKAKEQVYQDRLAICLECPDMKDATCSQCGCYVELRAAKASAHCPAVPRRW